MFRSLVFIASLLISGAVYAQCPATVIPSQSPACLNQNFTLTASSGANTYQWFLNGNPIGTNNNVLATSNSVAGTHIYTAIIDFGNCIDTVDLSMNVVAPPVILANNNNPMCGATLLLTASNCVGCTYNWTGPNGFTSMFQNPAIPNVISLYSGIYTVMVSVAGCMAAPASTTVTVQPNNAVTASNGGQVCIGDTLELFASYINNATYTWTGPGGFTSTLQNPTVIVDNTILGGGYSVLATDGGCNAADTTNVNTCNTMFINLYNDLNSNCSFDIGTDYSLMSPSTIKIDSNGIALDTVSAIAGLYYTPLGNAGDIYSFTVLGLSGELTPTCPVTGTVSQIYQPFTFSNINIGVECSTSNNFDLAIVASNPFSMPVMQTGHIYAFNSNCLGSNATVTLHHSPKYQHYQSYPPATVSGNTLTWNLINVDNSTAPIDIYYRLLYSTSPLTLNDTTHSYFTITPITGDVNPTNNTWTKVDTVVASYDPNAIMAYPEGCVTAGTKLQYTIMFENIGNAPAENIYVMDTLPGELEANTMELVMSSHNMYVTKLQSGGNTIFRFDFPNINLPDSSDHAGCHGMLVYTINTNSTLPYGADIDHRAGIYFDYNSVVMTNTYRTSICVPAGVSTVAGNDNIMLYPNPAGDELTLQTDGTFNNCTITNSIGQVMLQQDLNAKSAKLNIQSLAPGIYYMNVKGEGVQEVLKFVKM